MHDRAAQDAESLKKKFDKLAATKRKAVNPTYPEPARRAKQIARAMLGSAKAEVLGAKGKNSDWDLSLHQSTTEGDGDCGDCQYRKKRKGSRAIGVWKRHSSRRCRCQGVRV